MGRRLQNTSLQKNSAHAAKKKKKVLLPTVVSKSAALTAVFRAVIIPPTKMPTCVVIYFEGCQQIFMKAK
jgi:hypothetical protein